MKDNVGKLEEELREVFLMQFRKEFTAVVQGVSCEKRLLMIFQYGFEKDLTLNQLDVMTVEKRLVEEEPKVSRITEKPYDTVTSEKLYYNCVSLLINFNEEDSVNSKDY